MTCAGVLRTYLLTTTLCAWAPLAAAEPVRLAFVARVESVYDPGDALREAIEPGQLLRGTLTYDTATADADPAPGVARYEHTRAPSGFLIEAGTYILQTDPAHVELSLIVANDDGTPARDSYRVISSRNRPFHTGATISRISWELGDHRATAIDSTALTATAPDLTKWRSEFGLTIEGRLTVDFVVRAHVTEVTRVFESR